MTAIVWFRRDLRLADNPALHQAAQAGAPVVPLYVHAPDEEAPWAPGAASRWWLHHSLAALDRALRARGAALRVHHATQAETALVHWARTSGASVVYAQKRYEPAERLREQAVAKALVAVGVRLALCAGNVLRDPESIRTGAGEPYRVFTPYWRKLHAELEHAAPLPAPKALIAADAPSGPAIADLALLPSIAWDQGIAAAWQPGEQGAHAQLRRFLDGDVRAYREARDRPDWASTSRLSPHLHFGEIGPRQIVAALARAGKLEAGEAYVRELAWRDFSIHLLTHFPHTTEAPLNSGFARFPWARPVPKLLRAWQRGRTGIPIVDAGMRELWQTGWMHNRVRMIVASLLTKNLRYHWLEGARWFWDTLVDADLANNTQGWQWTAGSGADAAPYFRIFNPVSQGERFDPDGAYVRRYVPELAKVPTSHIHAPWTLRPIEHQHLGIADAPYARPLIDLATTRAAALAAYQQMRSR
jgi:deoxyribodipyrimidine photo-lyase